MLPRRRLILYGLIMTTACFALADEIADVALTWLIVSHTASPAWLGVAGALGMVPLIAGAFFGGALVDRIGVRRTALLAGFFGLGIAVAIPVSVALLGVVLPLLLASVLAAELFDAPAELAIEARLPELARFGAMPLERVNALDELAETLAALAGPLVAGVAMVHLGAVPLLWLVAAIAALGVTILCVALPRRRRERLGRGASQREPLRRGFHTIWRTPVLRWIIAFSALLVMLLASMEAVLLPMILHENGWSALELGWVLAAAGAGAAIGTAVYAVWGHKMPPRALIVGGVLGLSGSIASLALLSSITLISAAAAIGSAAAGPMSPLLNTVVQREAPRARRGTTLGVATGVILLAIPPGLLVVGGCAELFGAKATLIGLAVAVAMTSLPAMTSRAVTEMGQGARRPATPGRSAHGRAA